MHTANSNTSMHTYICVYIYIFIYTTNTHTNNIITRDDSNSSVMFTQRRPRQEGVNVSVFIEV